MLRTACRRLDRYLTSPVGRRNESALGSSDPDACPDQDDGWILGIRAGTQRTTRSSIDRYLVGDIRPSGAVEEVRMALAEPFAEPTANRPDPTVMM